MEEYHNVDDLSSIDRFVVLKTYLDEAGDLIAGIMLSFISLSLKNGLGTIEIGGVRYLPVANQEWWAICRISVEQVKRGLSILRAKKLIHTKVIKRNGTPVNHITLGSKIEAEPEKEVKTFKPRLDYWGYVYVIHYEQDLYKIGISEDVESRMVNLQIGTPKRLKLVDKFFVRNPPTVEQSIHINCARYRVSGEWFRLSAGDLDKVLLILRNCSELCQK